MSGSWAQFEAKLRQALGKDEIEDTLEAQVTSSASTLNKNDQYLFGTGSISTLLVVSCHICSSLIKPAFLSHHIYKVHGRKTDEEVDRNPSYSDNKCINKMKPKPSREEVASKGQQPQEPIKVTIKYDAIASALMSQQEQTIPAPKPAKPGKPKAKGSKRKNDTKAKKEDTSEGGDFRVNPSPPSLYPGPGPSKPNKRSRSTGAKDSKADTKARLDLFDFKSLIRNLPMLPPETYYETNLSINKSQNTGLRSAGYIRRPRPLATQHYNCRSLGAGQVVFTRRSDNLVAELNALFPNRPRHKCTSEIKYQKPITDRGDLAVVPSLPDDILNNLPHDQPLSPNFDKIFDILEGEHGAYDKNLPDDLVVPDWTTISEGPIRTKPFQTMPNMAAFQLRPNVPKLKVDTNQIRSNSAMSVFDFDDLEDHSRHDEERAQLLAAGGTASNRKNKRKLPKSPSNMKQVNSVIDLNSPPLQNNKRGKYDVIDLDKSPSPISSPNLKQQYVTSPRQFSFMLGYNEQTT